MCRIVGFWDLNFKGDYNIEKTPIEMRDTLIHGGPDDAGVFVDVKNGLALGHRRLSILDLSPLGHQPMEFENLVIVYNGEVYNYLEIRKELEKYRYRFYSKSDTEVVLKAFHKWNFSCVHKFRGMWAFAIWEKKEKRLILCRDRVGVKPLYWYFKDGLFMFASELKAFHKHPKFQKKLNVKSLPFYFKYGYIPTPYSIFENTFKLEPGHYLIIDQNGNITIKKYWAIEDFFFSEEGKSEYRKKEIELIEKFEAIFTESFKLRLVSDVPVGVFLSGGIDSSLVTALLQKESSIPLKTFTIGFYEKKYDEAPYAKKVAQYLGTDHYEFYVTPKEAYEVIPKLPEFYDEPFGDSSAVPTYLVSKYARQVVKVALSADGGDEQFCGYTNYWPALKLSKINSRISYIFRLLLSKAGKNNFAYNFFKTFSPFLKVTNFRDKYSKLLNAILYSEPLKIFDVSKSFYIDDELRKLLKINMQQICIYYDYDNIDILQSMMMQDIKTYMMDDILVKVDRATMRVSLEGREPFLDNRILEFSARLPVNLKCNNGVTKYILRKILYKYIPRKLIERPKKGFSMPLYEWFRKELKELYEYYLSEKKFKEAGIFNEKFIRKLLNRYYKGEPTNSSRFWLILMFQMWRERWM